MALRHRGCPRMNVWEVPQSSRSDLDRGFLMDVGPTRASVASAPNPHAVAKERTNARLPGSSPASEKQADRKACRAMILGSGIRPLPQVAQFRGPRSGGGGDAASSLPAMGLHASSSDEIIQPIRQSGT